MSGRWTGDDGGGTPHITISQSEFRRFCDYFYRHTGMHFTDSRRYYIDRRLAERARSTGHDSFSSYFAELLSDPAELERLVSLITVNETYFFREEHQFRALTNALLPAVVAGRRTSRPVRIASMPCSTGEETYSLALWLLEYWAEVDRYDVEIVGADIDTRALAAAREGVYGQRALSRLPPGLVKRYFEHLGGERYCILQDLRDSVAFERLNIVDAAQMARYRDFDVIFCRNLLIYFDEQSRRQAAENLYDCLTPGGFICLGHTESMSRISALFTVHRTDDAIVYRRPGESAR